MAGRKPGYRHPEEVRNKIKGAALVNRLTEHVMASEPTMDSSQVNAAKALLAKIIPDLKAVELAGEVGVTINRRTIYEAKPD